ncbi:uncharacterized protein LOC122863380 [Siniperca chuatsi]|uniref:uncharacterized protein LOC122863380 n=1 Tax=Siniperca chuatsi TaxID=119488 RepID=UPI001CE08409|nr:uncharacterized protein LOC122863380 [Siniperca chuatsi]XP_044025769.1 uncharacterized protein LOC122863380 [Siniperca chuatsi]
MLSFPLRLHVCHSWMGIDQTPRRRSGQRSKSVLMERIQWWMVDMKIEALSKKREELRVILHDGSSSAKQKDKELPAQTEAETLRQEVEEVHGELQFQASTGPVQARRPPQNPWGKELTLKKHLQETNYHLQQGKEKRLMAELNRAIDRSSLRETEKKQEEQSLRLKREKEVQRPKDDIKNLSLSSRVLSAEPLDESKNTINNTEEKKEELIRDLKELQGVVVDTALVYLNTKDSYIFISRAAQISITCIYNINLLFKTNSKHHIKKAQNTRINRVCRIYSNAKNTNTIQRLGEF